MENVHKFPQLIHKNIHDLDLVEGKKISKKRLINILNYINFKNGILLVNLKHIKYDHTITCQVRPSPCLDSELLCIWAAPAGLSQELKSYQFQDLLVPDGQRMFLVKADLIRINEKEICLHLPNECSQVSSRKTQRHLCEKIKAQMLQHSASFSGVLVEFSPFSFCIEVNATPPQTFQWIDPECPVNVIFSEKNETYYTGSCKIIRQTENHRTRNYVLSPLDEQIRRFKPKEFRSTRQQLNPLPNIIFRHPLTKKMETLKVVDLSGSGFAVEENEDAAVLLPGLIIPELELNFANSFLVNCKAQVIYRKEFDPAEEKEHSLKCGLTLLDMNIEEHRKLLALLHHATDSKSYLGTQVDMDALWDFFFESGFIYPQKYTFLQANKDTIKTTYERFYTSNPTIARHFIYQDNGRIMGHMTMIRFFENSWLIQHHAANRNASNRAGLAVLNQVGRFINDSQRLYSIHMNYVFCYFRPENKFPERVFGGVCRHIKDPKGCSLDPFAYLHYRKTVNHLFKNEETWTLTETRPEDLEELKIFYEHSSGGLMLSALEIEPGTMDLDKLTGEFKRLGFKRERYLFSLKKNNSLKAVFIANISDIGLNLSELTNCIQAIIIDPNNTPRDIFYDTLSHVAKNFEPDEIPILVFPVDYAQNQSIPYEKLYNLWVLNMHNTDDYFKHLKRLLKYIQH